LKSKKNRGLNTLNDEIRNSMYLKFCHLNPLSVIIKTNIMNQENIFIATDHAGYKLKEELRIKLEGLGYKIADLTPNTPDAADDYPDAAKKLADEVLKTNDRGILLCGSGNGVCIAANKIAGIRAAVGYNNQAAKWARADEDANVLCLAGSILSPEYALSITRYFIETPFSGEERHIRRINKIKKIEEKN